MNQKRAVRRHHLNRMKAKAIKVYHWNSPERAIKMADRLCSCSCSMCGNPRKWFEYKTRQEMKFDLDAKEQENEHG
jgi:hypothetical protein